MAESEPFTFITKSRKEGTQIFDDYQDITSARVADVDVQLVTALRLKHPELIVTTIPTGNVSLLNFAAAGLATAELDTETDTVIRWRGFIRASERGGVGSLGDAVFFAKYHYKWGNEDFILYTAVIGLITLQYVLKEPRSGETTLSHSSAVDALIATIGQWGSEIPESVYVYDGYWYRSTSLWNEIQKASWDKVILDPDMKKSLTDVSEKFFDSKEIYDEYGVPWKRGLIFYGPPGNGKTISIKALMKTLGERKQPVPTLYVKAAPYTFNIAQIFALARIEAPCLLILEDIDTIVTKQTKSYFFNEVDGLENNGGILMVGSTNHLDQLDPGLSQRPSRFDRKYLFPLPSLDERIEYCQFWRKKVEGKPIDFPEKLCPAIAGITKDFSFAYLQELFIASLLVIARDHEDENEWLSCGSEDDGLKDYELWRVIKKQAKILRGELDKSDGNESITLSGQAEPTIAQGRHAEVTPHPNAFVEWKRPAMSSKGIPIFSRRLTPVEAEAALQKGKAADDVFGGERVPRFE